MGGRITRYLSGYYSKIPGMYPDVSGNLLDGDLILPHDICLQVTLMVMLVFGTCCRV